MPVASDKRFQIINFFGSLSFHLFQQINVATVRRERKKVRGPCRHPPHWHHTRAHKKLSVLFCFIARLYAWQMTTRVNKYWLRRRGGGDDALDVWIPLLHDYMLLPTPSHSRSHGRKKRHSLFKWKSISSHFSMFKHIVSTVPCVQAARVKKRSIQQINKWIAWRAVIMVQLQWKFSQLALALWWCCLCLHMKGDWGSQKAMEEGKLANCFPTWKNRIKEFIFLWAGLFGLLFVASSSSLFFPLFHLRGSNFFHWLKVNCSWMFVQWAFDNKSRAIFMNKDKMLTLLRSLFGAWMDVVILSI